jgi:hypothetical protein
MKHERSDRRAALAAALCIAGTAWLGCSYNSDRDNARPVATAPEAPAPAAAPTAPPQGSPETVPGGATPPMARSHGPIIPMGQGGGPGGAEGSAPLPPGHPAIAGGDVAGAPHWVVPKGWQETAPTSAMRRAQYKLPAAAGDADEGECVVFYFGAGQGGDTAANIARWTSMMSDPDGSPAPAITSEMHVGDKKIMRLKSAGTYTPVAMGSSGPPPAPKSNWVMLGAVVPGGDANWFFRCAGPRRTILAQEPAFDSLLNSIR